MQKRRRLSRKCKHPRLDKLTEGAKRELESYMADLEIRIIHEAEEYMLRANRAEVSEGDIQKAKRIVRLTPTSGRKWFMRICTILMFAIMLSHFVAFSELPSIQPPLLFRLYFPTIAMLIWMGLLTFFYKEDLL
jgi:histone H3/H4